jgi:arylformamidase
MFVRAGAHFVVPDFSPVQRFDGDLNPMVDQLRRALAWIHRHARDTVDGDPARIHLVGFSSGAHLASVLLTTDWTTVDARPADLIKGALLCSGMYDLEPVSLSSRRDYVRFTPATIDALSAMRHLARINCPVIVAHGTFESPEFQRQARDFASALRAAGKQVTLLTAEGYNHFEIIESLAHPYGALGRALLQQISLSP